MFSKLFSITSINFRPDFQKSYDYSVKLSNYRALHTLPMISQDDVNNDVLMFTLIYFVMFTMTVRMS